MTDLLAQLHATRVGSWVLDSATGYPTFLVLHSIGLALLVGIFSVVDLWILGVARLIPRRVVRSLMRVGWAGFGVTVISGCLLFMADPTKYYYSATFRWKLLSILVGAAIAQLISFSALRGATRANARQGALAHVRVLAALSLLCWLCAITTGRLMAYLS